MLKDKHNIYSFLCQNGKLFLTLVIVRDNIFVLFWDFSNLMNRKISEEKLSSLRKYIISGYENCGFLWKLWVFIKMCFLGMWMGGCL